MRLTTEVEARIEVKLERADFTAGQFMLHDQVLKSGQHDLSLVLPKSPALTDIVKVCFAMTGAGFLNNSSRNTITVERVQFTS